MKQNAWIISVNMGYGHQRTAYPLGGLGKIINANDYPGIPEEDKRIWQSMRVGYEFISRFKRIPIVGDFVFSIFDFFQRISQFYPKRDLSHPNFALEKIYSLFEGGWGKNLIENLKLKNANLPIISTFFTPAFMAEYFNYPGQIFCVICDTDISRTWAPLRPKKSKIKYFAPTERVAERLKLYGVKPENIFLTGYPLPLENIGSDKMEILKEDLRNRILNLDPKKRYFEKYGSLVLEKLGSLPEKSDHPLTILFSVGGAGAQKEIGVKILQKLYPKIKEKKIKIILSAGIKDWVRDYFMRWVRWLNLKKFLGESLEIISEEKIENYFQKFNQALRKTDILWTKPSELSFYSALGIPIIISPPIGSQEEFNMKWLLKSGFGTFQENLNYLDQWLFDWLKNGYLAEMAMKGFIEGEKLGTFKISRIVVNLGTNIHK
jgi:hypothetical protein